MLTDHDRQLLTEAADASNRVAAEMRTLQATLSVQIRALGEVVMALREMTSGTAALLEELARMKR